MIHFLAVSTKVFTSITHISNENFIWFCNKIHRYPLSLQRFSWFFFTIRRNSIVICSCNSSAFIILLHLNKGFIYTLTAQTKLNSISELHFICPDPSPTIRLERYLSSLPWNLNFRGSYVWVKRRSKSKL